MSREQWQRLKALYAAAENCASHERVALLDKIEKEDPEICAQLRALLANRAPIHDFLEQPVARLPGLLSLPATIGRYRLMRLLGEGGMGTVYEAKDSRLERIVALKFLTESRSLAPDSLKRFEREALTASAINHPNICTVHDVGEYENRPFLVLEFLEGQTLRDRIGKSTLTTDEILDWAIQMTDALDATHQKGIIHRDIKPANIFITAGGQAKILDFGLAKLRVSHLLRPPLGTPYTASTRPTDGEDLTTPGIPIGTAAYMSPEQARGEELDERTDLFSLGAVIYEMTTGRAAFSGATIAVIFDTLLNLKPIPICDLAPQRPSGLEEIIARAVEKNRSQRYPTALALLADLRNLKQDLGSRRRESIRDRPTQAANSPSRFTDSIAIFAFENLRGGREGDFLGEGIAETVINNLSQLPSLRVIPRTSAFGFQRGGLNPVQAGRELGVRVVLTGRVTERVGRLTVAAELIDCTQHSQIWGEKYDRPFSDLLRIEAEIAQEIASKLRIRLNAGDRAHLAKWQTENFEAHKLFLKAMYHANRWTAQELQKGIDFARRAIDADPAYPMPYFALGYIYVMLGFFGIEPPREAFPRAKSAALKALETEEDCARAHALLGMVGLFFDWDWNEAQNQLRTALHLTPNNASCHWDLGYWLLAMGRCEEAIAEMKEAQFLDPLSAPVSNGLANAYYWNRQYDLALQANEEAAELDPSFLPARRAASILYARTGRYEKAFAELNRSLTLPLSDQDQIAQALVCAISGQSEDAYKTLSSLKKTKVHRHVIAPGCAAIHAALGEQDEALNLLEESYEERVSSLVFLAHQPEFERLHDNPRFTALLRRMGLVNPKGVDIHGQSAPNIPVLCH